MEVTVKGQNDTVDSCKQRGNSLSTALYPAFQHRTVG